MEWEELELSTLQLDAIREVGNIGAGNAATALSQLLGRTVDMEVPVADLVSIYDIPFRYGSPESQVCAILIRVEGDFSCNLIFVMEEAEDRTFGPVALHGHQRHGSDVKIQMRTAPLRGRNKIRAFLNAISMMTDTSFGLGAFVAHECSGPSWMWWLPSSCMGETAVIVKTP
jgi:chemotaxis protein CheC